MRAVLDTNVLISALNYGGIPEQLLDLSTDEAFVLCLSTTIVEETKRILQDRFRWPEARIETVLEPILSRGDIVEPTTVVTVSRDPDDDHILACATEAHADVIVSGDNDLVELANFQGISILTPRQFLDLLAGEQ
jgi:uncharacterized protein